MKSEFITAELPCPITNTREASVICERDRHGAPLRTIINHASGLVYTDPRPNHEEIRQFYAEEYRQQYKGSYSPKLKHIYRAGKVALSRWNKIHERLQEMESILDAGAGGGELMYLLDRKGYEVHGIEPNKGYAEYAKKEYNVNLEVGFFEDVRAEPESFDAILLFHVLEHLEDPIGELGRLCSFLKPGGLVVIEVPNVTYSKGYPTAKWHIGHLYNFNTKTLAATAGKAELFPEDVFEEGDGGNLVGFFEKQHKEHTIDLQNNYEMIIKNLKSHTLTNHLLSLNPYVRPIKRISKSIRETLAVQSFATGKEILDYIYN